jgi:hypothetical protein
VKGLSSYEVGAFEALEWAWHVLRSQRGHRGALDEATQSIQEALANMGRGNHVDFRRKVTEMSHLS